jgi:hypothetical protein
VNVTLKPPAGQPLAGLLQLNSLEAVNVVPSIAPVKAPKTGLLLTRSKGLDYALLNEVVQVMQSL